MIDYQDLFHVGVRVRDLTSAMTELGTDMGLIWAEVRESPRQQLWTPTEGEQELHLRYTYSAEGPQHVELLEGPPGTFWDGRESPGAHHVGLWVDDVGGETERIAAAGWTVVGAQRRPDDGYGAFSYVQPPCGLIVELVDRRLLGHFEAWWRAATDGRASR